jgi:hypothetical protein
MPVRRRRPLDGLDRAQAGDPAAGNTVTLSLPEDHLPLPDHFKWWVSAMTGNASHWLPYTFNPNTAARTFGPLGGPQGSRPGP